MHQAEPTELTSALPPGYFAGRSEERIEWVHDPAFLDWTAGLRESRFQAFDEDGQVPSQLFTRCRYCLCVLVTVYDEGSGTAWEDPDFRRVRVAACECGWWSAEDVYAAIQYGPRAAQYDWQCISSQGRLRTFDVSDAEVPTSALRVALASRRFSPDQVNPYVLERLVGDVLADFFDCEVQHVGRSGDGGIDLLVIHAEQPRAVQVKRRSTNKAEPVSFIREFLGAMMLGGHLDGIYITTAPRFSRPAIEAAKRSQTQAFVNRIELVDAGAFLDLTCRRVPSAPGTRAAPSLSSLRPLVYPPQ